MKNKLKLICHLGLIIFGLIFFTACENEPLELNAYDQDVLELKEDPNAPREKRVNISEIPSLDAFISKKVPGQKQKNRNGQNSIETPFGNIALDNVLSITDQYERVNYMFTIQPENPKLDVFYNLIVYQSPHPSTEPLAYVLKYEMSDAFFDDFYSGRKTIKQFAGRIYKYAFDEFMYNKSLHAKMSDPCNSDGGGGDGPSPCPIEDTSNSGDSGNSSNNDPGDYIEVDYGDTSNGNSGGGGNTSGPGGTGNTNDPDVSGGLQCNSVNIASCCTAGYCYGHPSVNGCGGASGVNITITTCVDTNNNLINDQNNLGKGLGGGCELGEGTIGVNILNIFTGSIFTGGMGSARMDWLNENCPERQLMFFLWNNSPMTSAELPLYGAMVDMLIASDNVKDVILAGEIQNGINQGGLSYTNAISMMDFAEEFSYTNDVFDYTIALAKALTAENETDKAIADGIITSINNNTVFDFSSYINPNAETINIGATGVCPNPPCDLSPDFETLWTYGGDLLQGVSDAFYSSLLRSYEWWVTDKREGKWIRNVLKHKGVDFNEDIDNETLGEMFIVRYDGSQLVIRWDAGLGVDLLDLGFDVLDVATILSPSRGGGAYFAVNGGLPITKAALKAHLARLKQIAETTLAGGRGYKSFEAFKRVEGNASTGNALHHIVEQNGFQSLNQQKFGKTNIHNTKNIIDIPTGDGTLHDKVTRYYGRIHDFTDGKRFREWIKDLSFEEQYQKGLEVLYLHGWDGVTGIID